VVVDALAARRQGERCSGPSSGDPQPVRCRAHIITDHHFGAIVFRRLPGDRPSDTRVLLPKPVRMRWLPTGCGSGARDAGREFADV
jgi:hypothetical protein